MVSLVGRIGGVFIRMPGFPYAPRDCSSFFCFVCFFGVSFFFVLRFLLLRSYLARAEFILIIEISRTINMHTVFILTSALVEYKQFISFYGKANSGMSVLPFCMKPKWPFLLLCRCCACVCE